MNKFNIRDSVWLIHGNAIRNYHVSCIFDNNDSIVESRPKGITYHLYDNLPLPSQITFVAESRLFKSREELIKSLS